MAQISLHRALGKIKLIKKKVLKKIEELEIITHVVSSKKNKEEIDKYAIEAEAQLKSIKHLFLNEKTIKSAIVLKNAETEVTIGKSTMTIAEAIVRKDQIDTEFTLLKQLKNLHIHHKSMVEKKNVKVDQEAYDIIKTKNSSENDTDNKQLVELKEMYVNTNSNELVDPLNLQELIHSFESELNDFVSNVDTSLSEINAITMIEVED